MTIEKSIDTLAAAITRLALAVEQRGTSPVSVASAEPAKPVVVATVAAPAAPVAIVEAPAAVEVTQPAVIAALTKYAQTKGLDAIKALVKELGATTVVGIDKARWAEAIAKAAL